MLVSNIIKADYFIMIKGCELTNWKVRIYTILVKENLFYSKSYLHSCTLPIIIFCKTNREFCNRMISFIR
jgi:hypothetical protein